LDRADHSIVDPDPFSIFLGGGGSRITRVGWERSDRPAVDYHLEHPDRDDERWRVRRT
jgi:hypothetical protein